MRKLFTILLCFICSSSFSGVNGLTWHSRANCINNESITWDATKKHWLHTDSYHYDGSWGCHQLHVPQDAYHHTRRSAAVCWKEGFSGNWKVVGNHYKKTRHKEKFLGSTTVTDCSIYDGWWECKTCEKLLCNKYN